MAQCPICFSYPGLWTDDPILTPNGLAGEAYKGFTYVKKEHMVELQDHRKNLETLYQAQLPSLTTFSNLTNVKDISKQHILELRESTENVLLNHFFAHHTKLSYFNYDVSFNYKGTKQTDWNDVDLLGIKHIRALHIEDLRHDIKIFSSLFMEHKDDSTQTDNWVYFDNSPGAWFWTNSTTWTFDLGYDEDDEVWKWVLQYHWRITYWKQHHYNSNNHHYHIVNPVYVIAHPEASFSVGKIVPTGSNLVTWTPQSLDEEYTYSKHNYFEWAKYEATGGFQNVYYESPTYPSHSTDGTIVLTQPGTITPYTIDWFGGGETIVDETTIHLGKDYAGMFLTM